jgi:hypothetical protein
MGKPRQARLAPRYRLPTVVFFVLGIALFVGGHVVKYGSVNPQGFLVDFYEHYFVELLSILVIVFWLDRLTRLRDQRQEEEREKGELVLRLGEGDHWAVNLLRERRWLQDGSLRRARLDNAYLNGMNLQGADLREADLRNATCTYADLRDANLQGANLQDARLYLVKYNRATRWPEGVDPVERGAILLEP